MNKHLPDGWKWIKLGDIAFEVSDRIDNPSESGLERFVGLEHLDSESLTVKRWGSTDDVTSAMKLFKTGDMLFARRNAYLKRASMATFDGVCSGDAIVLRQKNEEYVNGLLPLILNTEKLWEFAIANASGSMSKRVKWRDLATFEVPLAPKDEQRRIAEILWAAEDCIVKKEKLVDETEYYKKILMNELFIKGIGHKEFKDAEIGRIPKEWEIVKLKDICKIRRGASPRPIGDSSYFSERGRGWIRISDVTSTYKYLKRTSECLSKKGEDRSVKVNPGDLIMSICATIGKPIILDMEACIHDGFVLFSELSDKVDTEFLFYQLLRYEDKFINKKQSGTQGNLNTTLVGNTLICLSPLPEQRHIAEIFSKLDDTIQKAQDNINKTKELKKMLINQFLNGGLESAVSINPQSKQLYKTQVSE